MKLKILFLVCLCHLTVLFLFYEKKTAEIKETKHVIVKNVKLQPPPPRPKPVAPQIKTAPIPKKAPPKPIPKKPVQTTPSKKPPIPKSSPPPPLNLDALFKSHFQTFHLPEYGEVVLELAIKKGKIDSIKVIKSESEENLNYLKEALQKFSLPNIDKNRSDTHTLTIQFNNKITDVTH